MLDTTTSYSPAPSLKRQIVYRMPAEMIVGCMLNWKGIAFTEHMKLVMDSLTTSLREGRAILEVVVRDADYKMPLAYAFAKSNQPDEGEVPTHRERDLAALRVVREIIGTDLQHGMRFIPTQDFMDALRWMYKKGVSKDFCHSCRFNDLCTSIAENDFKETKLLTPVNGLRPF